MNTVKLDRRAIKSRGAIHAAFAELLFEQGYQSLTLNAVAMRANVGRSTLYEHFHNKRDVLNASLTTPLAVLATVVDCGATDAHLLSLLAHLRQQQRLARTLLAWPLRSVVSNALSELVCARLKLTIAASVQPVKPMMAINVIAAHIAESQLAMLEQWLLGKAACDAVALAAAMRSSAQALLTALVFRGSQRPTLA